MMKGKKIMKCLRVENGKALFLNAENEYGEIDLITKDDIMRLLDLATDKDTKFEMDDPEIAQVQNEAHKIIYTELYGKFKEVLDQRDRFFDESERLYKEALEKYGDNNQISQDV